MTNSTLHKITSWMYRQPGLGHVANWAGQVVGTSGEARRLAVTTPGRAVARSSLFIEARQTEPLITEGLLHPKAEVRADALKLLADEKGVEALPVLCEALNDRSESVRDVARRKAIDVLEAFQPEIFQDEDGPLFEQADLIKIFEGRGAEAPDARLETFFVQTLDAAADNPDYHALLIEFLS
ncbi:MAG: hypothetical protein ABH823_01090, partial [bacterium]